MPALRITSAALLRCAASQRANSSGELPIMMAPAGSILARTAAERAETAATAAIRATMGAGTAWAAKSPFQSFTSKPG